MGASPQQQIACLALLNKNNLKNKIYDQANHGTILTDVLTQGKWNSPGAAHLHTEKVGEAYRVGLHLSGNPNAGMPNPEGASMPPGGSQGYGAAYFFDEDQVTSLAQTLQAIRRASGEPSSFFNIIADEGLRIKDDIRRRRNRSLFSNGSGILTTVRGTGGYSAGVIPVADSTKIEIGILVTFRHPTTAALPTHYVTGTNGIGVAEPKLAIVTARDTTAAANTITVNYYDLPAAGFVGSDGNAFASTDFDTLGVYFGNTQGRDVYGLLAICGAGNPATNGYDPASIVNNIWGYKNCFGSIDRGTVVGGGTNEYWQAYYLSLAGATPTITNHFMTLRGTMEERDFSLRQERKMYVISDYTRWCEIVLDLEARRITQQRTTIKDGQYDMIQWGPFTFGYDSDCPAGDTAGTGRFFGFTPDDMHILETEPLHMDTETGPAIRVNSSFGLPTSVIAAYMRWAGQVLTGSCRTKFQLNNAA